MPTYDRTRGHSLKLNKSQVRTVLRQHFFSERVISIWNKLDNDTVYASSLNCFKHRLEKLHKDESFHRLLQSVWHEAEPVSPGEASSGKLSGKLYTLGQYVQMFQFSKGSQLQFSHRKVILSLLQCCATAAPVNMTICEFLIPSFRSGNTSK